MADDEKPPAAGEHGGEHQADEKGHHLPGLPGGKGAKPDKDEKRKTAIIVVLTAVGVLIAWMTLRKNPGSAATGAPTTPTGSSATDPANYPQSNGDVAGYGLGNTNGFDPNAYMGLQQQLDQLDNKISQLSSTIGAHTTASGPPINIYTDPPPGGRFPWSPHVPHGTPHPLAISAEAVLKDEKPATIAAWAKKVKVPVGSVHTGPHGHVWTTAKRG